MRSFPKFLRAGCVLAAVTLLAACGSSSSSSSSGGGGGSGSGPITIGTSLSLSGDFAADGQAFERGYQLWVADKNRAGGLLGHKLKLDVVSDASSPAQVVSNYEKLIRSEEHTSELQSRQYLVCRLLL